MALFGANLIVNVVQAQKYNYLNDSQ